MLGCGAHIHGEDLPRHLSAECPKRVVPCPLGCPEENLWAEEVGAHLTRPLHVQPSRFRTKRWCGKPP